MRQRINQMAGVGTGAHAADRCSPTSGSAARDRAARHVGRRNIQHAGQELGAGKALEAEIEACASRPTRARKRDRAERRGESSRSSRRRPSGSRPEQSSATRSASCSQDRARRPRLLQQLNAELETAKAEEQRQRGERAAARARRRSARSGRRRSAGRSCGRTSRPRRACARGALDDFNRRWRRGRRGRRGRRRRPRPPVGGARATTNHVVERMSAHIAAVVKKDGGHRGKVRTHLSGRESGEQCCKQQSKTRAGFPQRLNKSKTKTEKRGTSARRTLNACKERLEAEPRGRRVQPQEAPDAELAAELATLDGARAALGAPTRRRGGE